MTKLENLIGKRFGRLVVLERAANEKSNGNTRWKCLCDCGNEVIVQAAHFKSGNTLSCGCYRKEKGRNRHLSEKCPDMVGLRFGHLTVLERDYNYGINFIKKRVYWKCLCDCCGKVISVSGTALRTGKKLSCKTNHLEKGEAGFNFLYRNYKNGAEYRGLDFKLTKEEFKNITKQNCFYCGSPPASIHRKEKDIYIYNGIDRINNSKGYTKKNIVPCCKTCNMAKRKMTCNEFKDWIVKVYKNYIEKGEKR